MSAKFFEVAQFFHEIEKFNNMKKNQKRAQETE
jgi:hypothetical protein